MVCAQSCGLSSNFFSAAKKKILSLLSPPNQHSFLSSLVLIVDLIDCRLSDCRGMASMANSDRATEQPSCQNCGTQTTPLWRRDENGSILCNACGLFLKLHGRARPISLKTDVIKSRNRVKTMRPDHAKPKKVRTDHVLLVRLIMCLRDTHMAKQNQNTHGMNGTEHNSANGGDPSGQRRPSQQRVSHGHVDENNSPISRTGTPNLYQPNPTLPMYHGLDDPQFQAQGLPGFGVPGASPGRAPSPLNGERLDLPQTNESILAANASLKTRVSELEVIQELYRSRLAELEQGEAQSRQALETGGRNEVDLRSRLDMMADSEAKLGKELEESHRRENILKRRLDEMEAELKDTKEALEAHRDGRAKKVRLDTDDGKAVEKPGPKASA